MEVTGSPIGRRPSRSIGSYQSSPTAESGTAWALPEHFRIDSEGRIEELTVTGTLTTNETFHMTDPSCRTVQRRSGPATYEFSLNGTVVMSEGLMQYDTVNTGKSPGEGSYGGQHWGGQGLIPGRRSSSPRQPYSTKMELVGSSELCERLASTPV